MSPLFSSRKYPSLFHYVSLTLIGVDRQSSLGEQPGIKIQIEKVVLGATKKSQMFIFTTAGLS